MNNGFFRLNLFLKVIFGVNFRLLQTTKADKFDFKRHNVMIDLGYFWNINSMQWGLNPLKHFWGLLCSEYYFLFNPEMTWRKLLNLFVIGGAAFL